MADAGPIPLINANPYPAPTLVQRIAAVVGGYFDQWASGLSGIAGIAGQAGAGAVTMEQHGTQAASTAAYVKDYVNNINFTPEHSQAWGALQNSPSTIAPAFASITLTKPDASTMAGSIRDGLAQSQPRLEGEMLQLLGPWTEIPVTEGVAPIVGNITVNIGGLGGLG